MKTFKEFRESLEIDEALNLQQRMMRSRLMKRIAKKVQMGAKRARNKMASMDQLKKRAKKAARNLIFAKLTKGVPKDELSMARKQEIEKKLDKMSGKIAMIAKKQLKVVREREMERHKNKNK